LRLKACGLKLEACSFFKSLIFRKLNVISTLTLMTKNKYAFVFMLTAVTIVLQVCKPAQSTTASKPAEEPAVPLVSYEKDIKPILLGKCTPCHFPETGKKKMLDNYAAVKTDVNEILRRVKLNPEEAAYMPFKSKKPALTADEIAMLDNWLKQGMPN
jgi:uncharacterized membrane protein